MASPQHITLHALTQHINQVLQAGFRNKEFLVIAVINNLSHYASKDFYFFELIEKSEESGQVIAKIAGSAFGKASAEIRKFQDLTGQVLRNDLKLLISVTVDYHPVHGLKLNLIRIDPEYTLGSLERERRLVLERLLRENPEHIRFENGEYVTRNKQALLPQALKRLAVISSSNSAGFQDLMHSLGNNDFGYTFQTDFFFTGVQGEQNSFLMVQKLIDIYTVRENYDAVLIVRGGGSSSDLFMFNSYELSRAVARFPLPVITGIGHQKNETIVDLMAYAYTKTPTKAAEWIIAYNHAFENRLKEFYRSITLHSREILSSRAATLNKTGYQLIHASGNLLEQQRKFLSSRSQLIQSGACSVLFKANSGLTSLRVSLVSGTRIKVLTCRNELDMLFQGLKAGAVLVLKNQQAWLSYHQKMLFILGKEQTLKRGYALITLKGEPLGDETRLQVNDSLEIELHTARVAATVTSVLKN